MTHTIVYLEKGCTDEQLAALIRNIKKRYLDAFALNSTATSVVVHELDADEMTESMHNEVLLLVYTALGKGREVKRRCVKALSDAIKSTLGDKAETVEVIIKEQASDMTGENGIMRANDVKASSCYEG